MLEYLPSQIAAAATLLSNRVLDKQPIWPEHMERFTKHTEVDLCSCVSMYRELLDVEFACGSEGKLRAIWNKFSTQAHQNVVRNNYVAGVLRGCFGDASAEKT